MHESGNRVAVYLEDYHGQSVLGADAMRIIATRDMRHEDSMLDVMTVTTRVVALGILTMMHSSKRISDTI